MDARDVKDVSKTMSNEKIDKNNNVDAKPILESFVSIFVMVESTH